MNVTGPDAFDQDLTTSSVLTDLTPGAYSATANPVTDGSNDYSATINGSPAEVSSSTGAGIEVAYTLDPGSLDLTIDGLPGGVAGNVLVEGANGFSQAVTADTTLTDLAPGIYTLTALGVRTDDPIVSEMYDAPPAAVEVTSNATANASATYDLRPGSGHFWVPNGSSVLEGYTAAQLAAGGTVTPAVSLSGLSNPESVAFDRSGNVWVGNASAATLERFLAADLASDGSPTPDVTITAGDPWGIAFDADGNLWVANNSGNSLDRYRPDQLLADGSPTPDVTLSSDGSSLLGPTQIAFDADGNLWVSADDGDTVEKFTPAQQAASGSPAPDVTISPDATANLDRPFGIAFDASGALWVAAADSSTVLGYQPAQLAVSGNPTPAITISDNGGSLNGLRGLAFDNEGGLWVANFGASNVVRFSPTQLTASGNPIPDVTLDVSSVDVTLPGFNPPPSALPINVP